MTISMAVKYTKVWFLNSEIQKKKNIRDVISQNI